MTNDKPLSIAEELRDLASNIASQEPVDLVTGEPGELHEFIVGMKEHLLPRIESLADRIDREMVRRPTREQREAVWANHAKANAQDWTHSKIRWDGKTFAIRSLNEFNAALNDLLGPAPGAAQGSEGDASQK